MLAPDLPGAPVLALGGREDVSMWEGSVLGRAGGEGGPGWFKVWSGEEEGHSRGWLSSRGASMMGTRTLPVSAVHGQVSEAPGVPGTLSRDTSQSHSTAPKGP